MVSAGLGKHLPFIDLPVRVPVSRPRFRVSNLVPWQHLYVQRSTSLRPTGSKLNGMFCMNFPAPLAYECRQILSTCNQSLRVMDLPQSVLYSTVVGFCSFCVSSSYSKLVSAKDPFCEVSSPRHLLNEGADHHLFSVIDTGQYV